MFLILCTNNFKFLATCFTMTDKYHAHKRGTILKILSLREIVIALLPKRESRKAITVGGIMRLTKSVAKANYRSFEAQARLVRAIVAAHPEVKWNYKGK